MCSCKTTIFCNYNAMDTLRHFSISHSLPIESFTQGLYDKARMTYASENRNTVASMNRSFRFSEESGRRKEMSITSRRRNGGKSSSQSKVAAAARKEDHSGKWSCKAHKSSRPMAEGSCCVGI